MIFPVKDIFCYFRIHIDGFEQVSFPSHSDYLVENYFKIVIHLQFFERCILLVDL